MATTVIRHNETSEAYGALSDQDQITTLLRTYGAVLSTRSLPSVLNLYTTDGVLMAPNFAPSVGQEALKKSYERIFSTIKLDIQFTIDEIVVMDDKWAFARTTAEGTKYWIEKGTQESHHNQEIFVCRKDEGEWKIARYCFSSMKAL
ncbi:hypothetical protein D6C76_08012 [Aureobasidium pullulans]|nr:hypothetical protein D6C76_08012 [Aureobasidium pullulans]